MKRKKLAAIGMAALLALLGTALLAYWGRQDQHIGKWAIVNIDITGNEVDLPEEDRIKLEKGRSGLRKRLAGQLLEFTRDDPGDSRLEGSVKGVFHGGWARSREDESVILVYAFLSGPIYTLWGRATCIDGGMRIVLTDRGEPEPILGLRRR